MPHQSETFSKVVHTNDAIVNLQPNKKGNYSALFLQLLTLTTNNLPPSSPTLSIPAVTHTTDRHKKMIQYRKSTYQRLLYHIIKGKMNDHKFSNAQKNRIVPQALTSNFNKCVIRSQLYNSPSTCVRVSLRKETYVHSRK